MNAKRPSATQIDALLPQTQCGLCSYKGCMPYAEALANDEAEINLCPPGGVDGLFAIADLLNKDAEPFIAEMEKIAKSNSIAVIREAECIGCTKCIQACPVDAILGAAKQMHSVISSECTGCELCIAPCPVDCIDMITLPKIDQVSVERANHYRNRFLARESRLQLPKTDHSHKIKVDDKKAYIRAALLRAQAKIK